MPPFEGKIGLIFVAEFLVAEFIFREVSADRRAQEPGRSAPTTNYGCLNLPEGVRAFSHVSVPVTAAREKTANAFENSRGKSHFAESSAFGSDASSREQLSRTAQARR